MKAQERVTRPAISQSGQDVTGGGLVTCKQVMAKYRADEERKKEERATARAANRAANNAVAAARASQGTAGGRGRGRGHGGPGVAAAGGGELDGMKLMCCISLDYLIEMPACRRQIALGAIDFVYKTSVCRKVGLKFLRGSTGG